MSMTVALREYDRRGRAPILMAHSAKSRARAHVHSRACAGKCGGGALGEKPSACPRVQPRLCGGITVVPENGTSVAKDFSTP